MKSLFARQTRSALARWKNEDGAAAKNEGGAVASIDFVDKKPQTTTKQPSIRHGVPDTGMVDRHTLGVMQISFALLIPTFAAMLIFWAF